MTTSVGQSNSAAAYCAARLNELIAGSEIRTIGTGKVRKLKTLSLLGLIQQQFPDVAMSQTQLYRYVAGERAPRLDELLVFAAVFGVSPRVFVPGDVAAGGS